MRSERSPGEGWTAERVNGLRQFWAEGLTAREIAAAIGGGLSHNAVIGKARRLGLAARPSPIVRGGSR